MYGALALTGCGDHPPGETVHDSASPMPVIDVASFAEIPGGTFTMGCVESDPDCESIEQPAHEVTISNAYFMLRHEVTVADFARFVLETGHHHAAARRGEGRMADSVGEWQWVRGLSFRTPLHSDTLAHPDWPAVQIEWADANAYCEWIGGRLPTEAEWERASRGGTTGERAPWPAGGVPQGGERALVNGPDARVHARIPQWEFFRGYDDGYATLAPVGRFPPNQYGLHDMLGNAYEWTADGFDSTAYRRGPRRDPHEGQDADSKVVRGGSWGYYPFHHRHSWRGYFEASKFWTATVGFRCVRDALPEPRRPLWGNLSSGPHAVGFMTRIVEDSTRQEAGGPRRIAYSAWYPTDAAAPPMPFSRYAQLYTSGTLPTAMWRGAFTQSWFPDADTAAVTRLLNTATAASEGAQPRAHVAPIVLYAPGLGGTPLTHTVLLEFLASHGFLVLSVAARGPGDTKQGYDVPGLEATTDDLLTVLRSATRHLPGDTTRVIAAGFSFGGSAAALLGMRLPHLRAVISLDGSLTFADAHHLLAGARGFDPRQLTAPLLAVTSAEATPADLQALMTFTRAPRTLLQFAGMEHHDVIARHLIVGRVTGEATPASRRIFRANAELLLAFANAVLTGRTPTLIPPIGVRVEHFPVGDAGEPPSAWSTSRPSALPPHP